LSNHGGEGKRNFSFFGDWNFVCLPDLSEEFQTNKFEESMKEKEINCKIFGELEHFGPCVICQRNSKETCLSKHLKKKR
jgi:hypothetical protein